MKTQKTIKINIKLDAKEIEILDKARAILGEVSNAMAEEDCNTILCTGKSPYDITDLIFAYAFLENFVQVTEICT